MLHEAHNLYLDKPHLTGLAFFSSCILNTNKYPKFDAWLKCRSDDIYHKYLCIIIK